ncbi:MAG TPA: hypothetical protein DGG95_13460 [Cytophagales bacterium]|jgi:hypothetical protein|nr:hypothetical protein [Cytophagales bacterium]
MKYFSFVLIFFLSFSCVDPYLLSVAQYQPALVVEGMITDQPGPYVVKISETTSINDQSGDFVLITGATVILKDDQGNFETLKEMSTGSYYTQTFQGTVGRTYSLSITTADGFSYESAPEKLLPVGDFSNLRYEFVRNEDPQIDRQISSTNGFNIYLDSDVLPEQESRVLWRWSGTYQITSYPQFQVRYGDGRGLTFVPNPPLCSGYRNILGVLKGPYYPCECCICWVTQNNNVPLLSDPNFVSNNRINNQWVAFVEANVRTMSDKYYLQVEQLSISKAMYDFWNLVKQQRSNESNLFQTPPPKTSGNLEPKSEKYLPVIGYFAACSIKTHVIALESNDVPYVMLPIDSITSSCLDVYKNSTNIKPSFW